MTLCGLFTLVANARSFCLPLLVLHVRPHHQVKKGFEEVAKKK